MSKTASSLAETQLQRRVACCKKHWLQYKQVQHTGSGHMMDCITYTISDCVTGLQLTQSAPLAEASNQRAHQLAQKSSKGVTRLCWGSCEVHLHAIEATDQTQVSFHCRQVSLQQWLATPWRSQSQCFSVFWDPIKVASCLSRAPPRSAAVDAILTGPSN